MPTVDAVALEPFVHDHYRPKKGDTLRGVDLFLAQELEAAGLVKIAAEPRNKMRPDSLQAVRPGKAPAAGTDASSSSSPAAPASRSTMRNKSGPGARGPLATK